MASMTAKILLISFMPTASSIEALPTGIVSCGSLSVNATLGRSPGRPGVLLRQPRPAPAADAPLADAHIHYSAPDWSVYTPDQVVDILDKAGIQRALVSSTPDDGTLKLYDRDPKRVVPMLRPYRTRDDMSTWWRDPSIIPYLEQTAGPGRPQGHRRVPHQRLEQSQRPCSSGSPRSRCSAISTCRRTRTTPR